MEGRFGGGGRGGGVTEAETCALKKGLVTNFAIFSGRHLCWSLFLLNFIKKRLQHWCFPVNIEQLLRTPILYNICKWLLLGSMPVSNIILVNNCQICCRCIKYTHPPIPPPLFLQPNFKKGRTFFRVRGCSIFRQKIK